MAVCLAAALGVSAQKPVSPPAGGKAISDELIGIFFEDISSAADCMPNWCRTVHSSTIPQNVTDGDQELLGAPFARVIPSDTSNRGRRTPSTPTIRSICA